MKDVLVHEPVPPELEALIQRRQALGQDRFDEVWEGVYHVTPGPNTAHAFVEMELAAALRPYASAAGLFLSGQFNLGEPDDYRVPDGGIHRERATAVRVPTVAIVIEIVSPGDETFAKFDFYAHHQVDELFIVDPAQQTVTIYERKATHVSAYRIVPESNLLQVSAQNLALAIDWPPA